MSCTGYLRRQGRWREGAGGWPASECGDGTPPKSSFPSPPALLLIDQLQLQFQPPFSHTRLWPTDQLLQKISASALSLFFLPITFVYLPNYLCLTFLSDSVIRVTRARPSAVDLSPVKLSSTLSQIPTHLVLRSIHTQRLAFPALPF
jgi:hypothetical protein